MSTVKLSFIVFFIFMFCLPNLLKAQLDFTQTVDRIGSNALYSNYQYQYRGINRDEYVRIKKQLPTLNESDWEQDIGVTTYVKYSFINRDDFSISIGSLFRIGMDQFSAGLMLDLNFGMHTQSMSTGLSELKRHGFYIGAGFGYATADPVISLEQVNYTDLPFDDRDNILVVDKDLQEFPYQPTFKSYGINFHAAYSYNYYGRNFSYIFLPSGIRVQGHLATDKGPSFLTIGLIFNYRVLGMSYSDDY